MATRGSIARQNADGSVTAIYVHYDSYLDGVGQTLVNHYRDPVQIDQLMQLGDLSSLDEEIGERHAFDDRSNNWCTAYGRDRGETDCGARVYVDSQHWLNELGQEYNYLWDGTEWLMSGYWTQGNFRSVTQMLLEKF